MRHSSGWIGLLVLHLFLMVGCDSSPSGPGVGVGTISASLNGTPWSVTTGQAQHNVSANLMVLFAPGVESYGLSINVPGFQGLATYALENQRLAVVTVGTDTGWGTTFGDDQGVVGHGTVTVTSFGGGRIAGTFQFTAHPSPTSSQTGAMVVTNGQFDLPVIPL